MSSKIYTSKRIDNINMSFSNPSAFENDKGGAIKASSVLGSIGGIAAGASALSPATAIVTAPIAAVASIGSAIAKLFGGGLTQSEMDMIMKIKDRVDKRSTNL